MILQSRRGLLKGLGAIIAAPAIVRASSLMPIKVTEPSFAYVDYSLGYIVKHEELARHMARQLAIAMRHVEETWAANIFNTGLNCRGIHYEAPMASAA